MTPSPHLGRFQNQLKESHGVEVLTSRITWQRPSFDAVRAGGLSGVPIVGSFALVEGFLPVF